MQYSRELLSLKNMIMDAINDMEESCSDKMRLNIELRDCRSQNQNLVNKLAENNKVIKSLQNSLSSVQHELEYYKEENARLKAGLRGRDESSCQNLRKSQKHSDEFKNGTCGSCSNHKNDHSCHHKDKLCVDNMHVGVCSMSSDEDIDEVVRMIIDTLKNAVR